jgi:hypothetical protein
MKRQKKAQLQMTETVAVLVVFFILLMFGLLFYTRFQRSALDEQRAEFASERAITVSLTAMLLPELRCSKGDNVPVRDCIDLYKLNIAQQKMHDEQDYYFDLFGYARVSVREYYPGTGNHILYENLHPDATVNVKTPIPVALYDPVQRSYRFGVLTIEAMS